MPRRKPQQTPKVDRIANANARPIFTFGPDHRIWKDPSDLKNFSVSGALVRLFPPAGAGPQEIEEMVGRLSGAQAVRVMPCEREASVPIQIGSSSVNTPGARSVIEMMAAEVPTSNREALRKLCEEVMTEVGL